MNQIKPKLSRLVLVLIYHNNETKSSKGVEFQQLHPWSNLRNLTVTQQVRESPIRMGLTTYKTLEGAFWVLQISGICESFCFLNHVSIVYFLSLVCFV